MNKNIMKYFGFTNEVNKVEKGICPFCNKTIDVSQFKDTLSLKEYKITGICQECQDEIFKEI